MSICLDIWTPKKSQAAFAALAQPTRLKAFRKLVAAHPNGLPAGEIAQFCKVPHNTMSTHLAALMRGGLIAVARQGRSMNYRADLDGFRGADRFHAARLLRRPAGNLRAGGRRVQRRVLRAGAQGRVMKLYMFEHCSLCFRVRMMAALKRMHLQETVVLDDDSDTMVGLVGKRVIPILVKDDGQPMLESMDMVKYIEGLGPPILVGPQRPEIADWADQIVAKIGAADHAALSAARPARIRHRRRARSLHRAQVQDLRRFHRTAQPHARANHASSCPSSNELDALIESPQAVNGTLSLDDIRVLPLLRSVAVVKGLTFPRRVRDYFETMMNRIGFKPLPVV